MPCGGARVSLHINSRNKQLILQPQLAIEINQKQHGIASLPVKPWKHAGRLLGATDQWMDHSCHSHLSVSYFSLLHVKLQCLWCLCAKIAKTKPPNLGLLSARLIIIKTTFQDWMCHTWNANRCEALALVPGFSCSTCQSPLISCSPFLFICTLLLQ